MSNRFVRQESLVPQDVLKDVNPVVIGVGAVGRQVAIQLTAIGASRITLVDFDKVDETNLATQGYYATDIGRLKVHATSDVLRQMSTLDIRCVDERFRKSAVSNDVVFCCVDSIDTRTFIWRALGVYSRFWCDMRMLGEVIRVLTAVNGDSTYSKTLFPGAEAVQGSCTAKSTIYAANVAAALAIHQFSRWLRGVPTTTDLLLSLLADELIVLGPRDGESKCVLKT